MYRSFFPKTTYSRNILTLIVGSGIAQAVPVAISPILTRLYTPQDFGILALFIAISAIASVCVTGRYELAILLPQNDDDALHIVALSMCLSASISLLLLLIVTVFNHQITSLLGVPALSGWLYWLPLSTMLIGIYTSLNGWSNRKSYYRRLAITRVAQTSSASLLQVSVGFMGGRTTGLISGQIFGQFISSLFQLGLLYRGHKEKLKTLDYKRVIELAKKYIDYPKFMVIGQLLNTASGYAPLFLLGIFFNPALVGFYSLSQRVLVSPLSVVWGSVGDVYRSEASRIYREEGNCIEIFKSSAKKLAIISLLVVTPVFLFGQEIFAFVFGEAWREAGEIASIISIMIFFQGVSSPLSQTILFADKQKLDLVWQLLRILLASASFYAGVYFFDDYKVALFFFSIAFSFLYLLHTVFQYLVAKGWNE